MLRFKKIDIYIQVFLILVWIIAAFCFLFHVYDATDHFILCYFVVGGWQLLGVLIHYLCRKQFIPHSRRPQYIKTVLITVVIIAALFPLIIATLFLLLFVSPCYAGWYLYICYQETKTLEAKILIPVK